MQLQVTIQDVAVRAGVSTATVSRVLSPTSSPVRPENRERVLQAVAELDYRSNRLAVNLRRQAVQMIGVVVSDIQNPHFAAMVRAIEDIAYQTGYRVLLCNTDEIGQKQDDYLDILAAERVSGVIISPSDPRSVAISRLLDLGIAVVAVDRTVHDERADSVLMDNFEGGRRLTEHFIGAGYRHIGFVGGPSEIQTAAERLAGYTSAMLAAGLKPISENGSFQIDGGRTAAERLLDDNETIDALIGANNLMTIGLLRALRGKKIPDEVAVASFDDPFWADMTSPSLTTIAQPIDAIAQSAVALLVEKFENPNRNRKDVVYQFVLHVRDSCGARRRSEHAASERERMSFDDAAPAGVRGEGSLENDPKVGAPTGSDSRVK